MTKRKIVIASRESPLALKQTEWVKDQLIKSHPHLSVSILGITTVADKMLSVPLLDIGGKGLFVKELEEALLDGRADIAVHSVKDVPMELPPGLSMPVICKREDPRDVFVSNQYQSLDQLPRGARVGTSALRRKTQLMHLRPDLSYQDLRGNIQTRLSKLDQSHFDAIILASAGLLRMGLAHRIRSYISAEDCLPAAGQGALGIECLTDNSHVQSLIAPLICNKTAAAVTAERALCTRLGGGCKVPIASFAIVHKEQLQLRGLVANVDGTRLLRAQMEGDADNAASIGIRTAEVLIEKGAEKILREFQ